MKTQILGASALALTMVSGGNAHAQASPRSSLLDLPVRELRAELDKRYEAAVQASVATEVVRAEDSRFLWASETKVQCGIAIGFTKAGIKDANSINKCDALYNRLMAPAAPPPPPPPPPPSADCASASVVEVFFDWDQDIVTPEASSTIQQVAATRAQCNWASMKVTGHTDRSGSDRYNMGLSLRRANNVAAALEAMGISRGELVVSGTGEAELKVETADGVREPINRRVEIIAQPSAN